MDPFSYSNIILIFFCFITAQRKETPPLNSPPGPWKLPILGSMLHLVTGGILLPHRKLRNLSSKYGPVMHLQLGEISAIIITSPQAALEMLKTNDLAFATRPDFLIFEEVIYKSTNIIGAPYGAYWRQMRKICNLELLAAKKKLGRFVLLEKKRHGKLLNPFG